MASTPSAPPDKQRPRLSTANWIALAGLIIAAIALVPAFAGMGQGSNDSRSAATGTPTSTTAPTPSTTTSTTTPPPAAKTGTVKLTENQPGGVDLDAFKPILDSADSTGDLLLYRNLEIDLQSINGARILRPGRGRDIEKSCREPEEQLESIHLRGPGGLGDERTGALPVGSRICVETNTGSLASLTLTKASRMPPTPDDWALVFHVTLWPVDPNAAVNG